MFKNFFTNHPEKILGNLKDSTDRFGNPIKVVSGDLSELAKIDVSTALEPQQRQFSETVTYNSQQNLLKTLASPAVVNIEKSNPKEKKGKPVQTNYIDAIEPTNINLFTEPEAFEFLNPGIDQSDIEVWINYCNMLGRPIHPYLKSRFPIESSKSWYIDKMESGFLCWDPKNAEFVPRVIYYSGNVFEKISDLKTIERLDPYVGQPQIDRQLKHLEEIKPEFLMLTGPVEERLTLDPLSKFCSEMEIESEGEQGSILELFKTYLRNVDSSEQKTDVSLYYLYGYILTGQRLPNNVDKDEKDIIRRKCLIEQSHFMSMFLEQLPSSVRTQIEQSWNYQNNGFIDPNYNQVPVMFQCSKIFKDGPLFIRPEQREGVAFQEINGTGVCGYDVGVGKTLTAILTIAQFIQSGRCKRPIIIVPKPTYHKWIGEINGIMDENGNLIGSGIIPQYKINSIFNLSNEILERGFTIEDNTITIITYQGLKKLGFSSEFDEKFKQDVSLVMEQFETGMTARQKALEDSRILNELSAAKSGTEVLMDEHLWDFMTMDEAHNANKIFTSVKGETTEEGKKEPSRFRFSTGGQPSMLGRKSFFLSQYVQWNSNGLGNVNLLTATPFTNNPLNVYNIFALANFNRLKSYGIENVNTFFEKYVEVTVESVVSSSGAIESKEVIKGWKNKVALQKILFGIINYKSAEESPFVTRPLKVTLPIFSETVNGRVIPLPADKQVSTILKPSERQRQNQIEISKWLQWAISDREESKRAPHLVADIKASKNCLSPHIYEDVNPDSIDPVDFINESPKLLTTMNVVKGINDYHEANNQPRSGQIIYMNGGISYMGLIKEYMLDQLGYKRNVSKEGKITFDEVEILAGDGITDEQKEDVKNLFNDGVVKVIIGSATIREGIDLQKRTSTLHNLWIDWNPTDYKQLEGRLWRFGNVFQYVRIISYLLTGSSDAFKFQKLEEKTARINDIFDRTDKVNILEVSTEDREAVKWALIDDVGIIARELIKEKISEIQKQIKVYKDNSEVYENLSMNVRKIEELEASLNSTVNNVNEYLKLEGMKYDLPLLDKCGVIARSWKVIQTSSLPYNLKEEVTGWRFSSKVKEYRNLKKMMTKLDEKSRTDSGQSIFELDTNVLIDELNVKIASLETEKDTLRSEESFETLKASLEAEKSKKEINSGAPDTIAKGILSLNEKCLSVVTVTQDQKPPKKSKIETPAQIRLEDGIIVPEIGIIEPNTSDEFDTDKMEREIQDAIEALQITLEFVEGEEKKQIEEAIEALELTMEIVY